MLIILYLFLLALGAKATWTLVLNNVLSGASGLLMPIILFVVAMLVIGPIMGLFSVGKYLWSRLATPGNQVAANGPMLPDNPSRDRKD